MTTPRAPFDPAATGAALAGAGARRVQVVDSVPSTSSALVEAVRADPEAWPDASVVVAHHQTAGRGRAGRSWHTPEGAALTMSVLLRPQVPAARLGWLPLLTGLAVTRAVQDVAATDAFVKWPNDVLVHDPGSPQDLAGWGGLRKVAGVLAESVPGADGPAVVLGVGVNVTQARDELPVPSATSLRLAAGRVVDRTDLAVALVGRLLEVDRHWREHQGDHRAVRAGCAAVCATLGSQVRVDRPGLDPLLGTAGALGTDGQLLVLDGTGREHEVLAGDVHHVRVGPVN